MKRGNGARLLCNTRQRRHGRGYGKEEREEECMGGRGRGTVSDEGKRGEFEISTLSASRELLQPLAIISLQRTAPSGLKVGNFFFSKNPNSFHAFQLSLPETTFDIYICYRLFFIFCCHGLFEKYYCIHTFKNGSFGIKKNCCELNI